MTLKAGDKVECVDTYGRDNWSIKVGNIYKVADVSGNLIIVEGIPDQLYMPERFKKLEVADELVEAETEVPPLPMLTMQLGAGLGITLDPNIPFSRKFAEAFLDAIYGKK